MVLSIKITLIDKSTDHYSASISHLQAVKERLNHYVAAAQGGAATMTLALINNYLDPL